MGISSAVQAEIDSVWKRYEKGGSIKDKDLGTVARAAGLNPSEADIADGKKKLGGSIDKGAFEKWFGKLYDDYADTEDMTIDCFRVFDRDGNGQITLSDFKAVLGQMGEKLSEKELNEVLKETDVRNNMINYEEFTRMLYGNL